MGAASIAESQQVCLPLSGGARAAITRFLQDSSQFPWLRARGITALQAGDLPSLTDVPDAALCKHLDSVMVRTPASYVRAAAYIIASSSRIDPTDSLAPVTLEISPGGLLLFDSTGTFVRNPYDNSEIVAPPDLHAAEAIGGSVVLAWTNRSSNVVTYRMQRALGSAAFATIGSVITSSATSARDTSAVAGGTYRYRLIAFGTGDSSFSNETAVALTDIGSVTRTTVGLLFRDQFNRVNGPPGSDWTIESGGWAIVNDALQVSVSSGQNLIIRLSAIANRRDYHVQVLTSRSQINNYAPVRVRHGFNVMYQADLGSSVEGNVPRLYRFTGWWSAIGTGKFSAAPNVRNRMTVSALANKISFWVDGGIQVRGTDALGGWDAVGYLALNAYGSGVSGTVVFDDLVVCLDRTVTISGLPAGFRLRVGGIMSSPADSTGVASLDLFATQLPVARIEILDGDETVVKIHSPSNGVWGGDRYALVH